MGTRAAELVDVAGHTGPEETLADAMECLGAAEMSGGGGGMVSIKKGLTESGRDHNERNGVGRGQQGLMDLDVWMRVGDCVGMKVWVKCSIDGLDEFGWPWS